jgi:hypothetical protein
MVLLLLCESQQISFCLFAVVVVVLVGMVLFLFYLFIYFFSAGDQTQGLALARQALFP